MKYILLSCALSALEIYLFARSPHWHTAAGAFICVFCSGFVIGSHRGSKLAAAAFAAPEVRKALDAFNNMTMNEV